MDKIYGEVYDIEGVSALYPDRMITQYVNVNDIRLIFELDDSLFEVE